MSNISTSFVRIYCPRSASRWIDEVEAERIAWMLVGPRGSYCVPVSIRLDPKGCFVDIQYGSAKYVGHYDFCAQYVDGLSTYSTMWVRTYCDSGDWDVITREHYIDGSNGFCRYGFDEVRIQYEGEAPPVTPEAPWQREAGDLWRLAVAGSYRTGNDRTLGGSKQTPSSPPPSVDLDATLLRDNPLDTPTTPNVWGCPLAAVDPPWLASLADEQKGIRQIDYLWHGRVVHRTRRTDGRIRALTWENRCADDWDNCLDADFLRYSGQEHLLLAPELYERDQHDWDAGPGSLRV